MHTDNIDENEGDPEDILGRNQERLPTVRTLFGDFIISDTSYSSVVWRGQLSQPQRSMVDPANRANRGNRYNSCIRDNCHEQRTVHPDKSGARKWNKL